MEEVEAMEKAWLARRGGWRGEMTDSGGGIYGDEDEG